jgi:hypothetical protein
MPARYATTDAARTLTKWRSNASKQAAETEETAAGSPLRRALIAT